MNINKNQFEVLAYVEREGGKRLPQRRISKATGLSLGAVNKTVGELSDMGLLGLAEAKEMQVTKLGMEALEPYRVKRAVILAAGFGSRMVPITLNTPKPLVRVHGSRIIETLLDAIEGAGIHEIVIVRGYLGEQFDVLKNQHPEIRFYDNPLFNETNNISSAVLARDWMQNAYVMEADLLLSNPNLVRKYEYCSNYLGMYKEYTDDWCFHVKRGFISELAVGGRNCYHMYGISYWNAEDGKRLARCLQETFAMPGGKEKFWDEAPLRVFKDQFQVEVRCCQEGDIVEIDTFNELKKIDPVYNI